MNMTTVRIENVTIASPMLTQIWVGFISLGWPCNVRDTGAGKHTIEVQMPVGQPESPQAAQLFQRLGGRA